MAMVADGAMTAKRRLILTACIPLYTDHNALPAAVNAGSLRSMDDIVLSL
jgi:hypothetical protein